MTQKHNKQIILVAHTDLYIFTFHNLMRVSIGLHYFYKVFLCVCVGSVKAQIKNMNKNNEYSHSVLLQLVCLDLLCVFDPK